MRKETVDIDILLSLIKKEINELGIAGKPQLSERKTFWKKEELKLN